MSVQFSLPGFEEEAVAVEPSPAATVRPHSAGGRAPYSLFFAIFPPTEEARSIARQGTHWAREQGLTSKPLSAHRLHVTLHDLGNYSVVPNHLVNTALQAGYALTEPLFKVVFDRALSFPSSGTYVLCGGAGTEALAAFRQRLGEAMGQVGLPVKRSFTPHMTVAYDRCTVAEHAVEPVSWIAQEFVLIKSYVGQGVHEVLGRWALHV